MLKEEVQKDTQEVVVVKETYYKPEKFQRIRRITGYLVGDQERFCNAKKSEVKDRVTHVGGAYA